MDYLPICMDLRRRACLVVGGGEVAMRKAELLHRAGAAVRIVAPEIGASLRALAKRGGMRVARRRYASADLDGVALAIAATDRAAVNARVASDARERGVPINVVDQPALCTFIMPALVDRSPVVVALSTMGASPSLARWTRSRVETVLPAHLGRLAQFAGRHRAAVSRAIEAMPERRSFWDAVLEGEVAQLVLAGRMREADAAFRAALKRHARGAAPVAGVTLIGAGSGDPDELPLRAARALARTDLLLHDAAVPHAVLDLARRDAERVETEVAGARAAAATLAKRAQAAARAGRPVCVVLLGDPFAGGVPAEWDRLARAGVPITVVRPAPAGAGPASLGRAPPRVRRSLRSRSARATRSRSD